MRNLDETLRHLSQLQTICANLALVIPQPHSNARNSLFRQADAAFKQLLSTLPEENSRSILASATPFDLGPDVPANLLVLPRQALVHLNLNDLPSFYQDLIYLMHALIKLRLS